MSNISFLGSKPASEAESKDHKSVSSEEKTKSVSKDDKKDAKVIGLVLLDYVFSLWYSLTRSLILM